MAKLKDSGDRRVFNSGAVRDMAKGKGRCDLLPLDVASGLINDTRIAINDGVLLAIDMFKSTGNPDWLESALLRACHKGVGLFPDVFTMLLEVSKQFEDGAAKYGDNNWQKGIPVNVYVDSGVRHYLKFLRGDHDEPHDRAFAWNLVCAIWTACHMPDLNAYATSEEVASATEAAEDAN